MRSRAFRPEIPGCLEDRSLLSAVAGLSTAPVVFSHRRSEKVDEHIRTAFLMFSRDHDVHRLLREVHDVAVMIPFGRVDGLGASIRRIVKGMQNNLSVDVPPAVRSVVITSTLNDVIAATRAEVEARVQTGDVVVR